MQTEQSAQEQLTNSTAADTTLRKDWRTFFLPWWQATKAVLPVFLLTRFILILLSYFGGVLFTLPKYSPSHMTFHQLLYTWDQWDAKRFLDIATSGYTQLEYSAFFPLFPMMMRGLSTVTHLDPLLCGMLISNIAFLGTLIIFYRFIDVEFDSETAKRSSLYLAIFPTAMFFFAAYNESLFLLLMLLSFYSMRRGHWWFAGLFGGLSMLTRSISVFLAIVFVCEFLRQKWSPLLLDWQQKHWRALLLQFSHLLAILLIPLGLLIYAYGLQKRFGDPLAFVHAQIYWRKGLSFPWVAPGGVLKSIFTLHPLSFSTPHNILDLSALVIFTILLALAIWGPVRFPRDKWTLILFSTMALLYAVLFPGLTGAHTDQLASTQRFVLEMFAGFIVLGSLGRKPWFNQLYFLLALPMLAFFALQFMTGHWTV